MSSRINLIREQIKVNTTDNSKDFFAHVPKAPLDPILGMTVLYKQDKDPKKIDLGVGAYRTEEGKPLVFSVIKEAKKRKKQINIKMKL